MKYQWTVIKMYLFSDYPFIFITLKVRYRDFLVGGLEHLDYFPFHIWDNPSH
jgi:hypothetical protein